MEALDLITGISNSSAAAITMGGKSKGASSGFDALLAALTSQSQQSSLETSTKAATSGDTSSAAQSQTIQINSPADTPVAKLETALRQSGQPMEKITVPAEAREKMVEVLENSGYSTEDAEEILRRATDDEGNINLGVMFEILPQYTADQGPVLILDEDGKMQLMQALKDLGVPAEEIRRFFESADQIGDKIEIKGLTELLAMADPGRSEVDRSVLEDLLTKLGLSSQEITNILDSTVDSQGRISAADMLSILETAAEKNDTKVASALKTVANQIEVKGDDTSEVARQLRTMVTKVLEEAPVKSAEKVQTLQQTQQPETLQQTQQAQAETTTNANSNTASANATANAATNGTGEATQAETQTDAAKAAAEALGKAAQQAGAEGIADETTTETSSQGRGSRNGQAFGQTLAQQGAATAKTATQSATAQDSGASKFSDALTAAESSAPRGVTGQVTSVNRGIPAYVTRQVSQQMASIVRSGANSLTLNLKPAHLGSVNMEISMKDGSLQATLTADSVAAKHTLEAGLDMLRDQLNQQGIKIDRIEVAVNANADQQQQQQTAQAGGQSGNGRNGQGGQSTQDGQAPESQAEELAATQTTAKSRISIIA